MSAEESWDAGETSQQSEQQTTAKKNLGFGRGKPRIETNNDEPASPSVSKWNGGQNNASQGFGGFRKNNNNDENSNPNSGGGFGSRDNNGGGGFGARSGQDGYGGGSNSFRSNNDSNSRACYNCNETGHMSRDCPQPRKENRGGGGGGDRGNNRGGFNSGSNQGGGFNSGGASRSGFNSGDSGRGGFNSGTGNRGGFSSGVGFNSGGGDRNVNDGDRNHDRANGNNNFDESNRRTFNNSNNGGGFRGGRGGSGGGGGFGSSDRGGGNCYNCQKPGHQSRDCPEEKKPRDGGSNGFSSGGGGGGGRRNDRVSDDIFDQPGGRAGAQPTERYVPPPVPTSEDDIFGEAVSRGENFGKYHRTQAHCTPEGRLKPIELYEEANMATQILSNIRRAHFEEPTPIQRYTIPCIRQQDDIMACAQTGSGKTAAFLLPIIANLLEYHADELTEKLNPPSPLCLVLSPTRELALQTEREARKFSFQTPVIPCSAIGGHDMFTVSDRLREGCHILSATTGRLKDMVEKGRISLKKVKYFVLDEADRMLDTGFEPDIRKLEDLGLPPKDERFTSMFSATFPDEVQKLAKHFLRDNYIFLTVGTPGGANEDIAQTIEEVRQGDKKGRLLELLEKNLKDERCLIFVETKRSADYIGSLLSQKNLMSTTMHGDRTQKQRYEAVQQFTHGKCPILVATSVAARGLDFPLIGYVVNYDLPDSSDFYIHRIGRTGRAGHLGKSISFFDPERESDRKIAPDLVLKLSEAGQEVPEFLRQHGDGSNTGFGRGGYGGRNTDMRSDSNSFGSRNQASGPSGGTATAGGASEEAWD